MSVNNSINSGSAPTLTLDSADLIVISDTSNGGALSTCQAQDIADLGGGGAVSGVFPSAALTCTSDATIIYQYNVSSAVDTAISLLITFTSSISALATPIASSSGTVFPDGGFINYSNDGASIDIFYSSGLDTYNYFVAYDPA